MDAFIASEFLDQVLNLRQHAVAQREEPTTDFEAAGPDDLYFDLHPKWEMVNGKRKFGVGMEGDWMWSKECNKRAFSTDVENFAASGKVSTEILSSAGPLQVKRGLRYLSRVCMRHCLYRQNTNFVQGRGIISEAVQRSGVFGI